MTGSDDEPCELLTWDSAYWGFPVARVRGHTLTPERLRAIDQWCEERSVICLFFLAAFHDPTTIRCAEEGRFHLVDSRVTFSRSTDRSDLPAHQERPPWAIIRPAVSSDLDPLRPIAAASFRDSRFYFDQHFPRDRCLRFYERWLIESFNGFADLILVAERDGAPVGCATFHLPADGEVSGRSGLLFVADGARRRGLARAFKLDSLDWFAERNVPLVTVSTQGRNIATQALNQQCGFLIQRFELWYHKWYRVP